MKSRIASFAALALPCSLLPACWQSNLDPDDEVVVTGAVLNPDGSPHADEEVLLIRIPDVGEIIEGVTAIVGSIGLVCLDPDTEVELCEGARTATTDAEGAYRFDLLGSDTIGSVGNAVSWVVAANGAAPDGADDGPVVEGTTVINATEVEIPALTLWQPTLAIDGADGYALTWTDAPDDVDGAIKYTPTVAADGVDVWREGTDATSASWIDEDVEDYAGGYAVYAGQGVATPTSTHVRHTSQRLAWAAGDAVPQSRGDPCRVDREGVATALTGACAGTDGDLDTRLAPIGPSCADDAQADPPQEVDGGTADAGPAEECDETNDRFVDVDLGAVVGVSHVYVRGGANVDGHVVEVSLDDVAWIEAGVLQSPGFGLFRLDFVAGTQARFVRIRHQEDGEKVGSLAELSVY